MVIFGIAQLSCKISDGLGWVGSSSKNVERNLSITLGLLVTDIISRLSANKVEAVELVRRG